MTKILEFLIVKLNTMDGTRGSALKYIGGATDQVRTQFYLRIFSRFNLLRIRMKISYSAIIN